MDVSFEVSKKLNTLNMQACVKRLDKDTGLIYFDERHPFNFSTKKIPFIENLAYVLALFNHKNVEGFHTGEKILEKLLCFYKQGHFPKYIGDFPDIESPYTALFAYAYFHQMIKNFKPYLKSDLFEKLVKISEEIKQNLGNLHIYHHLEPLVEAILDRPIKTLHYSFESAYAVAIASLKNLPARIEPQEIKFTEHGHLMLSLFDFLKAQSEGFYAPYLVNDHPLHLKLAILYEPFEKKVWPSDFFASANFPIGLYWQTEDLNQHVFTFDENAKINKTEKTFTFQGDLELHNEFGLYFPFDMEVTQNQKKGTYFLKNVPIYVKGHGKAFIIISSNNLVLEYQKRKQELFTSSCIALKNQTSGPFTIQLEIH